MSSYTNIFGGSPVQPAEVSYISYTLSANLTLTWPTSFIDTNDVVARIMNISATTTGLDLILPAANAGVSVGSDFLIFNTGSNSFNVVLNDGITVLQTITSQNAYYFWLNGNTTSNGTWNVIQFGAQTIAVTAAALAGNGLVALNNKLNTNYPNATISSNYTSTVSDRANFIVNTGGSITFTLPTGTSILSGFYEALSNQGTGAITVQTADGSTIDGASSYTMNIGSSGFFIFNGSNWNKLGFGLNTTFQFTSTNAINLTGLPSYTLTIPQSQANFINFTGNPGSNCALTFPVTTNLWCLYNNTNASYTLSAQLEGSVGNVINIPYGGSYVVYSDSSSLYIIASSGVPPTYPGQTSINTLGTITTGTWNATPITVPYGGTGNTTFTPYSVITAGTTSTGPFQNVSGVGTSGQILTSNGSSALPTWQTLNAGVTQGGTGLTSTTPYALLAGGTTSTSSLQQVSGLGTTGQALISNGSGALPTWQNLSGISGYGLMSFTYLTSGSGTYTVPSGILAILVECIGGGGGGGGTAGGSNSAAAGGGAAGAYCRKWITSPSATYAYSVGSGGAGGIGNVNGTDGGTTTFGSAFLSAGGGKAGSGAFNNNAFNMYPGGRGQAATGGDVNYQGVSGNNGTQFNDTTGHQTQSGFGGSGIYGTGGYQIFGSDGQQGGENATGNGSGGSGSLSFSANQTGGSGSNGIIVVWQFA